MGTVNTVNSTDPLFRLQSILKMKSFKFLVFFLLLATVSSASLNSALDEEGDEAVATEEDQELDYYDDDYYYYEYEYDGDYDDYDYGEEEDEEAEEELE